MTDQNTITGLTAAVATARLQHDGFNELPQDSRRGSLRIVLDAVREPMLQLLLAAGVIYLLLGDLAEALILLAFAVLNVVLVAVQESRTERASGRPQGPHQPTSSCHPRRRPPAHRRQGSRG